MKRFAPNAQREPVITLSGAEPMRNDWRRARHKTSPKTPTEVKALASTIEPLEWS
jgi:hypothetical protein